MIYEALKTQLLQTPKKWLITGVAGFIGSHLLEELLNLDQEVVGIDNFATGHHRNLQEVKKLVSNEKWERFVFFEGDICNYTECQNLIKGIDHVLHQAALGSVPRSLENPINTNATNITGFLNMLEVSRLEKVASFTYAASSSTYGDHTDLPKLEENIGNPLSPYAVTKLVNEMYAAVFARSYGFKSIGLRYFNVFGPRQDPNGAYAAVIPKWTRAFIERQNICINGDGLTSRDFCYIANVVQANLLAATVCNEHKDNIFNVAVGDRTSLNDLFKLIQNALSKNGISNSSRLVYTEFRTGDVRHSQANIEKAQKLLGYHPSYNVSKGIDSAMPWYIKFANQNK